MNKNISVSEEYCEKIRREWLGEGSKSIVLSGKPSLQR